MRICGEIRCDHRVRQTFRTEKSYFNGVSVLVATYDDSAKTSHLELELTEASPQTRTIARKTVDLAAVYDNSFVEIFIEPDADSAGKTFHLEIWSDDAGVGNCATLYLTSGQQRIDGHLSCRSIGTDKAEDGIVALLSYAAPQSEFSVPPNLEISLVSQCNLNCVHCISRETRKVAKQLPEHFGSEIKKWANAGKLQSAYTDFSGDVFWADSRFGDKLNFFIDLDVPFHIDTNGTHITEAALDRVFASKVTSINVSIDAGEAETYKKIRRGSPPLEHIFNNMALVLKRRQAASRKDVTLSASFVLMKSNISELPTFIKSVAGVGFDEVRTIHVQAHTEDMIAESLWYHQHTFNQVREDALATATKFGIRLFIDRAFVPHADHEGTSLCHMPWNAAYLLANGDVLACCIPGLKMGNLHEESMEAIWNGDAYRELRRTVNSDKRPDACRACPFNRKTNNSLSYMPVLARRKTSNASASSVGAT